MPAIILALALLTSGCLASRTGALVFPTQSEVGVVTMRDGQHAETGVRYKTALSWASVSPDAKTPVDIGIGYQVDQFASAPRSTPDDMHSASKSSSNASEATVFHGPVLEFSKHMGGTKHRRQWLGARVEMPMRQVHSQTYYGFGASLRASMELFLTADRDGVIGALGIGSYVESGIRQLPGGDNAFVMSTGLSLRLPLAVVN